MTDTPEIVAAREALNRTQVGVRHLRVMVDAYDRLRLTLLCERGEWAPEGREMLVRIAEMQAGPGVPRA